MLLGARRASVTHRCPNARSRTRRDTRLPPLGVPPVLPSRRSRPNGVFTSRIRDRAKPQAPEFRKRLTHLVEAAVGNRRSPEADGVHRHATKRRARPGRARASQGGAGTALDGRVRRGPGGGQERDSDSWLGSDRRVRRRRGEDRRRAGNGVRDNTSQRLRTMGATAPGKEGRDSPGSARGVADRPREAELNGGGDTRS